MAILRLAGKRDAQGILNVYAPYIESTAITFEYEVPEINEFQKRIGIITNKFPWIVCEDDGEDHRLCLCVIISVEGSLFMGYRNIDLYRKGFAGKRNR